MNRIKTVIWLLLFFGTMILSGIHPKDRFTWVMEIFPAWIAFIAMALTYKSFRLTDLAYLLILIHSIILFVGGHWTYAEVPLGDWVKEWLHQARNNYDKLGHFAQGFVPAILAREILIRKNVVAGKGWLFYLTFSICLSISAMYELLEWAVAEMKGQGADAFLGTQGDVWDTQSDMLMAAIGCLVAQVVLGSFHRKRIEALRAD